MRPIWAIHYSGSTIKPQIKRHTQTYTFILGEYSQVSDKLEVILISILSRWLMKVKNSYAWCFWNKYSKIIESMAINL